MSVGVKTGSTLNPPRLSLKARLLLIIAIALVGGMFVGGLFILHNARNAVQAEVDSSMRLARRLVTTIVNAPGSSTDPELITFLLAGLHDIRHVRARISPDAARLSGYASPPAETSAANAPQWFVRLMDADNFQRPRVVYPRGLHGPSIAFIEAKPADEIEEVWQDVRGLLILVGVLLLCLLGLLYWVVHVGLKPLSDLFGGFQRLEDGDFEARVSVTTVPELARIHRKFNAMAEVLRKTMLDNRLLARRVLNLQEEERRLLARDLHDEVGPYFFGMKADTSLIRGLVEKNRVAEIPPRLDSIDQLIVQLQAFIQGLLQRLRPMVIDAHAITDLVETWRARLDHIEWRVTIEELPDELSESVKVTVYRIIQESLTNVARHANASRVLVKTEVEALRDTNDQESATGADRMWRLRVIVEDDGQGMPPRAPFGLGLIGLRERVQALGGDFKLHRVEPHGLRVEAAVRAG